MKISGTVHFNEASSDRHQFIYGSLFNGNFVSLYGKFTIENGKLKALSILCHDYSKNNYLINDAFLEPSYNERSGDEVVLDEVATKINCITLKVDLVKNSGVPVFRVPTNDIAIPNDSYFEVRRKDDQWGGITEENLKFLTECVEIKSDKKGLASPGKICPRAYSKIIL